MKWHFSMDLEPINFREMYERKPNATREDFIRYGNFILDINRMVKKLFVKQLGKNEDRASSYFHFKRTMDMLKEHDRIIASGDEEYAKWFEQLLIYTKMCQKNQNGNFKKK